MTTQIDLPTTILLLDEPADSVRLTHKSTGEAIVLSLRDFEKLLRLGIQLDFTKLP